MKVEFRSDPKAREPYLLVCARERTPDVEALIRRLDGSDRIAAYSERGETLLELREIARIYTQQRKLYVDSDRGTYLLRARVYELEQKLDPEAFVRISNSEIVSVARIMSLDYSLTGTIRLTLRGGATCYVSRRYVARIRQRFES